MTIDSYHLRACHEHGVVGHTNDVDCPCCVTGVEARPGAAPGGLTDIDMRWQIESDTMLKLLPLLEEDAERAGEGPVYVAVAELPLAEVQGAAGYTVQERWFNVAMYEVAGNKKAIVREQDAQEAIEQIESGEGYIESPEYDFDRLDPAVWVGLAESYAHHADYHRVDSETLRITVGGFASDNQYKKCRREIGMHARNYDLQIKTVEAGGRWSEGIIEVSMSE